MQHTAHQPRRVEALLPVRDLGDIEFLVKESEILTGRAGRGFVIAGADRLVYRVHWHLLGFKVERLDLSGYGLVNAVTHYSQEVEDYDRATEFEVLGGKLIELSASEWKPLAEAA